MRELSRGECGGCRDGFPEGTQLDRDQASCWDLGNARGKGPAKSAWQRLEAFQKESGGHSPVRVTVDGPWACGGEGKLDSAFTVACCGTRGHLDMGSGRGQG